MYKPKLQSAQIYRMPCHLGHQVLFGPTAQVFLLLNILSSLIFGHKISLHLQLNRPQMLLQNLLHTIPISDVEDIICN